MALTRRFKDTVRARAQEDVEFRRELLREAVEALTKVYDAGRFAREWVSE